MQIDERNDMEICKGLPQSFLKAKKLKSGEDLTTKDKEMQNKLWPQIEEAHKQGKKAFFVGTKAIIDGIDVKV